MYMDLSMKPDMIIVKPIIMQMYFTTLFIPIPSIGSLIKLTIMWMKNSMEPILVQVNGFLITIQCL